MAELRYGSASHEGQLRSQNEDHAYAGDGLFVVADGMGGHLAGEVASEMAVDRLRERLRADGSSSLDDLVAAISEANVEIYNDALDHPDRAGMGTTVTAIAIVADPLGGEAIGVANVGDSRIYVVRHGRLRQLTVDHSFVQELVAEGAITRDEARTHPRRNIVTRALGIEPAVRVDSWSMPVIRGDRFVLCSDGLVDEVRDEDIADVLAAHPDDPEAAAQALVDAANAAGGRDNITVVVVDVLEGDDPPDPTEEFDVVPIWSDDDLEDTGENQIVADPPDEVVAAETLPTGTTTVPPRTDGPAPVAVPAEPAPTRKRSIAGQFGRFVLVLGVAAVLVLGFAILAAWARQGYYVDFDDDDQVVIYQGRDVLWFQPTVEAPGPYGRDELDQDSIELVEMRPEFESQSSAAQFVASRLTPTTTTSTTVPAAPTTTIAPTTTTTTTEPATTTTGG